MLPAHQAEGNPWKEITHDCAPTEASSVRATFSRSFELDVGHSVRVADADRRNETEAAEPPEYLKGSRKRHLHHHLHSSRQCLG
jgi:hypothetical protein